MKICTFHRLLLILFLFLSFSGQSLGKKEISDLYIKKSVDVPKEGVVRGDRVTYTVTFRNNGPNTATNVVVRDAYTITDNQSEFQIPENCTNQHKRITCMFPSAKPGAYYSFTYSAKINHGANLGGMMSYIGIYSDQKDLDERDNSAKTHFKIIEAKAEENTLLQREKRNAFLIQAKANNVLTYAPETVNGELFSEKGNIAVQPKTIAMADANSSSGKKINSHQPVNIDINDVTIGPVRNESYRKGGVSAVPVKVKTVSEYIKAPLPNGNAGSGPKAWILFSFSIFVATWIRKRGK